MLPRSLLRRTSWTAQRLQARAEGAGLPLIVATPQVLGNTSQRKCYSGIYSPIKHWQTRILRLAPGTFDRPLEARLEVATLISSEGIVLDSIGQVVSYDALSYTWGDGAHTESIHCGQQKLSVTSELSSALRHLRHLTTARHLWVDALCINQSDAAEKSTQIQHMMTIFEKAQEVIGWIGRSTGHTEAAFKIMKTVQSTDPSRLSHDAMSVLLTELSRLFSSAWLSRTWVRQEIFAARQLTLQCGGFSIDWDTFKAAALKLKAVVSSLETSPKAGPAGCLSVVDHMPVWHYTSQPARSEIEPRRKVSLLQALEDSYRFGVTDQRDRIYGLIGMTSTPTSLTDPDGDCGVDQQAVLPVHYRRSLSRVFQDVIKYFINAHGSLDIISLRKGSEHVVKYGAEDITLPSWAIDWRAPTDNAALRLYTRRLAERRTRSVARLQSFNSPHLHLLGIRIGRIGFKHSAGRRLRFDPTFVELAGKLSGIARTTSHMSHQHFVLDPQNWQDALRRVPDLEENDVCVYSAGSRCQHIIRPQGGGHFSLVSSIDIIFAIIRSIDRAAARKRASLTEFILI